MARSNPYLLVTTLSLAVVACQPRDPLVEAPLRIELAPAAQTRHWAAFDADGPSAAGSVSAAAARKQPASAVPRPI
jgi:hypothetical protein